MAKYRVGWRRFTEVTIEAENPKNAADIAYAALSESAPDEIEDAPWEKAECSDELVWLDKLTERVE